MGPAAKRLLVLGVGTAKKEPSSGSMRAADETEEDDVAPDEGDDEAKASAGEAFAEAVKSGDGMAIANAFSDLMAVCKEY